MTTPGEHLDSVLESGTARERVAGVFLDRYGADSQGDWDYWLEEADAVLAALGLEQVGWMHTHNGARIGINLASNKPAGDGWEPVYRLAGET